MATDDKSRDPQPEKRQRLELPIEELQARTKQLFAELDEDPVARSEFLSNPVGRIAALYGVKAEQQAEAAGTRVLFAMLANDRFRTWLEAYPAERGGKPVDQKQFASDFAQALLDYGDRDIVDNLLHHAAQGYGVPGFEEVFQQLVIGPEKSIVTSPATPSSSSAKVESSQNFEHKGFGLGEMSVINPAQMRAIMEQLIARAKNLSQAGKLAVKPVSRG